MPERVGKSQLLAPSFFKGRMDLLYFTTVITANNDSPCKTSPFEKGGMRLRDPLIFTDQHIKRFDHATY
jgi:hypothetical protein